MSPTEYGALSSAVFREETQFSCGPPLAGEVQPLILPSDSIFPITYQSLRYFICQGNWKPRNSLFWF